MHDLGFCATYGICGHRSDTDVLSCPSNVHAVALPGAGAAKLAAVCPHLAAQVGAGGAVCCSEEQLDRLQSQIQIASIFLVGCPACNQNFKGSAAGVLQVYQEQLSQPPAPGALSLCALPCSLELQTCSAC